MGLLREWRIQGTYDSDEGSADGESDAESSGSTSPDLSRTTAL